jgi:hypothetical protein
MIARCDIGCNGSVDYITPESYLQRLPEFALPFVEFHQGFDGR